MDRWTDVTAQMNGPVDQMGVNRPCEEEMIAKFGELTEEADVAPPGLGTCLFGRI